MSKIIDDTKEIFAKLTQKKSSEISTSNITKIKRKRKKKQSKNVSKRIEVELGEGLELIGEDKGTEYVDYDKLPLGRGFTGKIYEKKLRDWNSRDFVEYTYGLYWEKFRRNWGLRVPAACIKIKEVMDKLFPLFGCQDNLILRDYIFFCFENYIDRIMRERGKFYFDQLKENNLLESFYNIYNYKLSFQKEKEREENERKDEELLTNKTLKQVYLLDENEFICNYGIIIAINWFCLTEGLGRRDALLKVFEICKDLYDENLFSKIKESTKKWSPYPVWFIFKNNELDMFVKKINKNLSIDVDFDISDEINKKFNFIKEKNGKKSSN